MPRGAFRRFYATASLFTPHHDECFRGLAHPESDADRPVMAGNDADDFRIKPGRSRTQRTRVRSHDLPFLQQVKAAVRKAGGNPNRIGRGSGSTGSRKGEGGGRFNARGRGAKVVASFPKDGGGWSRDGNGVRIRSRRVAVKARIVKLNPQRGAARGRAVRQRARRWTPTCAIWNATASTATARRARSIPPSATRRTAAPSSTGAATTATSSASSSPPRTASSWPTCARPPAS